MSLPGSFCLYSLADRNKAWELQSLYGQQQQQNLRQQIHLDVACFHLYFIVNRQDVSLHITPPCLPFLPYASRLDMICLPQMGESEWGTRVNSKEYQS